MKSLEQLFVLSPRQSVDALSKSNLLSRLATSSGSTSKSQFPGPLTTWNEFGAQVPSSRCRMHSQQVSSNPAPLYTFSFLTPKHTIPGGQLVKKWHVAFSGPLYFFHPSSAHSPVVLIHLSHLQQVSRSSQSVRHFWACQATDQIMRGATKKTCWFDSTLIQLWYAFHFHFLIDRLHATGMH